MWPGKATFEKRPEGRVRAAPHTHSHYLGEGLRNSQEACRVEAEGEQDHCQQRGQYWVGEAQVGGDFGLCSKRRWEPWEGSELGDSQQKVTHPQPPTPAGVNKQAGIIRGLEQGGLEQGRRGGGKARSDARWTWSIC